MKPAHLAGDAFLADVDAARKQPDAVHLWWLGQSGFMVLWRGSCLLLDPYLSDALTKKYADTDKPHVRMTERVIAPERLDFVDVVTSTHNHTDHLDAETLIALGKANPSLVLIVPEANRGLVSQRLRCDLAWPVGLDVGETVEAGVFRITAVPAAHELLDIDEERRHRYLGYVVAFGGWTLYHSGDTVLYPGMAELLRRWPIDLGMLPINGRSPERRVAGNLDGREAAELAKAAGFRYVIPCHYDMFEFNTATPELFVQTCTLIGQQYTVLRNGERYSAIKATGA
jgi:L-ascorbate metabolism protein UlaG (beta-lactamase superfamily)